MGPRKKESVLLAPLQQCLFVRRWLALSAPGSLQTQQTSRRGLTARQHCSRSWTGRHTCRCRRACSPACLPPTAMLTTAAFLARFVLCSLAAGCTMASQAAPLTMPVSQNVLHFDTASKGRALCQTFHLSFSPCEIEGRQANDQSEKFLKLTNVCCAAACSSWLV